MRIPLKTIENIDENVLCKITQNKEPILVLALKNEGRRAGSSCRYKYRSIQRNYNAAIMIKSSVTIFAFFLCRNTPLRISR